MAAREAGSKSAKLDWFIDGDDTDGGDTDGGDSDDMTGCFWQKEEEVCGEGGVYRRMMWDQVFPFPFPNLPFPLKRRRWLE